MSQRHVTHVTLCEKPLPSDNFNTNNKNVIPSKYILVFDIQKKTRCVKWLKRFNHLHILFLFEYQLPRCIRLESHFYYSHSVTCVAVLKVFPL